MNTSTIGESAGTAVGANIHPSPPPSPNRSASSSLDSASRQYAAITSGDNPRYGEITDEPGSISRASTYSSSTSIPGGFFHRVRTGLLRSNTGFSLTAPASPTTTSSSNNSSGPNSPGQAEMKKQRRKSSGEKRPALRRKDQIRRHSGVCAPHYGHGRHSNEWLFGGWSVRETVKSVLSSD